jgi:hypothetical protein
MRHSSAVGTLLLTFVAVSPGCASAPPSAVSLQRPGTPPAASLADVRLSPGTVCIVHLASGVVIRGRLAHVSRDHVELDVESGNGAPDRRVIDHTELDVMARMVTMSRGKRARIGALVAALVSLPFGISQFGDMVIPAAIAGGVIGHNAGSERAEIVFERRRVPQ